MEDNATCGVETYLSGKVTDVFAHHVVLMTSSGMFLADLDPAMAKHIVLQEGDYVELAAEMHASYLRVIRIAKIEDAFGHEFEDPLEAGCAAVGPASALKALVENGFTILTVARREQAHLEFLISENKGGGLFELHTELDGRLRRFTPLHDRDQKWSAEIG